MQYFAPTQTKVHDLTTTSGALNAARAVCEGRPEPVRWKEGRAHVLADQVEWEDVEVETSSDGSKVRARFQSLRSMVGTLICLLHVERNFESDRLYQRRAAIRQPTRAYPELR